MLGLCSAAFLPAQNILTITTASLENGTINAEYFVAADLSGGVAPYIWTVSSGSLPAGVSLVTGSCGAIGAPSQDSFCQIEGTPTTIQTANFTLQVNDSQGHSATHSYTVVINPVPTLPTASPLPNGLLNQAYSQGISVNGGTSPYTWELINDTSLPPGLQLDDNTCPFPDGGGPFKNGARANTHGNRRTSFGRIRPNQASTCLVVGTPTQVGNYSFTIEVNDDWGSSASKTYSITIDTALSITTGSPLPEGTQNAAYATDVFLSGGTGPYFWGVSSGALPAGLSLDTGTCGTPANPSQVTFCEIAGTPTTVQTANFTLQVTDSLGVKASSPFALTINAPMAFTTPSPLPLAPLNQPYSQGITVTGGTLPIFWSVSNGSLPNGLSLDANSCPNRGGLVKGNSKRPVHPDQPQTCLIVGTPTQSGSYNFTMQVFDSANATASKAYVLNVDSALSITTASPLPQGTQNTAYSTSVDLSGGTAPYVWAVTAGSPPAGLSLDAATCGTVNPSQSTFCLITGTPTTVQTANFTLRVTDSLGETASVPYALTINPPLAFTTPSPLPLAPLNQPYSQGITVTGGTLPIFWSVSNGSLPNGLSLDANSCPNRGGLVKGNSKRSVHPDQPQTCLIVGTPTQSGSYNFTMQVFDSANATASKAYVLNVDSALSITTASPLPQGTQNTAYSTSVALSGGTAPYVWAVTAGSPPAGLSLDAATCGTVNPSQSTFCLITGTPTTVQTANFTLRVSDSLGETASVPYALTINPPLSFITASPLPNGTLQQPYSQGVSVTGGTPPVFWAQTSGTLPPGLSLDPNSCPARGGGPKRGIKSNQATETCLIVGTPTQDGKFTFTIQATDSAGATASQVYSITVDTPLSITSTSPLPDGTQNAQYQAFVFLNGGTGPYLWSITGGSLPAGLSLDPVSCGTLQAPSQQISCIVQGKPTSVQTANFTMQVIDSLGLTASAQFALTINIPPAFVTPSPLPLALITQPYSQGVTVSGGTPPYFWGLTTGALPPGLSLDPNTCPILTAPINHARTAVHSRVIPPPCQIIGVPNQTGSYTFTLQIVDDANGVASKTYAITVDSAMTITGNLPNGTVGISYLQQLGVNGGATPYTWSIAAGLLPAGVTLNPATGLFSGTPTASGVSNFTVKVVDNDGLSTQRAFTVTIIPALAITTSSPLPPATFNAPYSQTLTATGGTAPYTWGLVGTLPAGLSLGVATGQISGTPTAAGNFIFTIQVSDSLGLVTSKLFSLVVNRTLVIISVSPLPSATAGVSYTQTLLASGGTPPYTWALTAGALPVGLSLNTAGQISGTPTTAGAANFTVQATDSAGITASAPFELPVNSSLTITTTTLPSGTLNVKYSQSLAATGGTPPDTWTLKSGALPAGLQLSTAGLISGTPTAAGPATFTVQVADSNGATATAQLTLTINGSLQITSASPLPAGTVNVSYSQTLAATGGTPPYSWTLTFGALPTGLTLSQAGVLSGKPTTAGQFSFTVQVTDTSGSTATAVLAVTINGAVTITTTTLPAPSLGSTYSQPLTASGTNPPFTWSLASGTLPAGLTLSPNGTISGTPTVVGSFTFTVLVTDANNNTASQQFTLSIPVGPAAPAIQGLPDTSTPQQQLPVTVALAQPYGVDLTGQLTLTFTPNPAEPVDDPAIQFTTGGNTVTFQIPHGQTAAVFSLPPKVQTGTVAGSLTLNVSLTADGVAVPLSNNPAVTVTLPAEAPGITSVTIENLSTGFNVVVTGFANDREITGASFTFTPVAGGQVQTTTFTPDVTTAFQSWFASSASTVFGGMFQYVQPFNITSGTINSLQSVSVTLTSAEGTSAAGTANF